jgi:N-acetylmuramate 1-kinase
MIGVPDPRFEALHQWLSRDLGLVEYRLESASTDASFRRYFRVYFKGGTLIAMDAPPEQGDCYPFVCLSSRFRRLGLNVPEVLEQDLPQGFLLLTDLGEHTYLSVLNRHNVTSLYQEALTALQLLQGGEATLPDLPLYGPDLLHQEMDLFREWYLQRHLGVAIGTALDEVFALLIASALEQPQVPVHRDYHSRNLMVTGQANPGILDFQDAVKGPVTYDLVSLLRDCYIAWPCEAVRSWLCDYRQMAARRGIAMGSKEQDFLRWFDWMGVQRHLKASGIFARLNYRDGKTGYLKEIPRTLNYISTVSSRYGELAELAKLLQALPEPVISK